MALRYLSATLNNLALLTYFFHILKQYSSITFVVTGYRCIYLSAELPKNTVLQVMMTYHDPSLWRAFCTCAGCIKKDTATEPPKKRSADNLLHNQLVNLIEDTSFNFLQPANNWPIWKLRFNPCPPVTNWLKVGDKEAGHTRSLLKY